MVSTYLRSVCCDRPLIQVEVFIMDMLEVFCTGCYKALGAPTGEDIERLESGELPWQPIDLSDVVLTQEELSLLRADFMAAIKELPTISIWLDDLIIGNGTEMKDGKWQPRGILKYLEDDNTPTDNGGQ